MVYGAGRHSLPQESGATKEMDAFCRSFVLQNNSGTSTLLADRLGPHALASSTASDRLWHGGIPFDAESSPGAAYASDSWSR